MPGEAITAAEQQRALTELYLSMVKATEWAKPVPLIPANWREMIRDANFVIDPAAWTMPSEAIVPSDSPVKRIDEMTLDDLRKGVAKTFDSYRLF